MAKTAGADAPVKIVASYILTNKNIIYPNSCSMYKDQSTRNKIKETYCNKIFCRLAVQHLYF